MRAIKSVLCAAVISTVSGAPAASYAEEAVSLSIPDAPTGVPCMTSRQCGIAEYCHPFSHVCYTGTSPVCHQDSDCKTPGAYCHIFRCHVGMTQCGSNKDCTSTQYCHYGYCHAEECTSDNDCPAGIPCITSLKVCALP